MFETLIAMLETLEKIGDVASLWVDDDGSVSVTFDDFDGFDEDWDELDRDYEAPELVNEVFALLDSCDHDDDFYTTYMVEGHEVQVGYTSYDI